MTRVRRPGVRRAGAALAAVVVALVTAAPATASGRRSQVGPATLTLVDQSKAVSAGGTFSLSLRATGVPTGGAIELRVHDRVRSRSELASSFDSKGLRRTLTTASSPTATLPTDADGTIHDALSLAAGTPAGQAVGTAGVYPTAVSLVDASGVELAGFVTDLVLLPAPSTATPALDVAVLTEIDAAPRPAGKPTADATTISRAQGLVDALTAVPDVPATLTVRPETAESIAATTSDSATSLLTGLRAVAATHPVLALPYVATSPDGLDAARLADQLPHLVDHGHDVLQRVLATKPRESAWLAEPDLGATGLTLLSALGVREAVVDPAHVEGLSTSVLTPARPFDLAPPRPRTTPTSEPAIRALATDARLAKLLGDHVAPALLADRVLADLAVLWFEQPGTRRAVVLRVPDLVDGTAVRQILRGLRPGGLFHAVAIDQAFTDTAPLTAKGTTARRALSPAPTMTIAPTLAAQIRTVRAARDSAQGMVGAASPIVADIDSHLLRSMAAELTAAQRKDELDGARAAIDRLVAAIQTPPTVTITLTARNGTVPLTIRNDTGGPVQAEVRLHSSKLELPGGSTIPVTIDGTSTRLDIAVRTRASGAFPIQVEVTSPDGQLQIASTRYSVRSTAVSGVGLILSIGAGVFLVVWWARHWRGARRSAKLVASAHPAVASARPRDEA